MSLFRKNIENRITTDQNADWDYLIDNFYRDSGDLPDIIFENCGIDDWKKFVDLVNDKYKVQFKLYEDESVTEKINFDTVNEFWNGNLEDGCMASVFTDNIQFNIFFGRQDEIDHDFDRREIKNFEDHKKMINYLNDICNVLDKEAAIYAEGTEEILLARVSKDEVKYYNK